MTRGTGLLIVNRLLQDGLRVRAVARDAEKARDKLPIADPGLETVVGDVTRPDSLSGIMKDVDHVIFTAGVTKLAPGERWIIATEYDGVKNTLAVARDARFKGRFLYMTSIGVTRRSLAATLLNLVKGSTLRWRNFAEGAIRKSGLDYTIVRAGSLTNDTGGRRAIEVSQSNHPLAWKYRISRRDVAEVFVQPLKHPGTRRTTFDVAWTKGESAAAANLTALPDLSHRLISELNAADRLAPLAAQPGQLAQVTGRRPLRPTRIGRSAQ